MNQQVTAFQDDLILLSDYLEEGLEVNWNHEIRKQILLILHRLKNLSRKLQQQNIENELIAIESTLGYGSGTAILPDTSVVEEHQIRLLDLSERLFSEQPDAGVVEEADDVELEPIGISKIQLILCNCAGRDKAREIAHGLVKSRLAACVNIIANIGSIYWWQGEIKDTAECQLQIKTTVNKTENVMSYIQNNIDEEIPEILAFSVDQGNEAYFDWVVEETND